MDDLLEEYIECQADIDVAKKRQAKELAKRKEHEGRLELIRVKIENAANGEDYKSSLGTVVHRKGVPKVIISDEKLIPKDWFITTEITKLDKAGIKSALKKGQEINGATLSNCAPTLIPHLPQCAFSSQNAIHYPSLSDASPGLARPPCF